MYSFYFMICMSFMKNYFLSKYLFHHDIINIGGDYEKCNTGKELNQKL